MSASDVPVMLDASTPVQTLESEVKAPAPLVLVQEPPLHKRVLPWLSLCAGIASAVTMDRGPRRAAFVAAAALIAWFALLLLHWLVRTGVDPSSRWRQRVLVAIRHSPLMSTHSTVQLGLFFALPFYWQAASFEFAHGVFLLALAILSALTLWDPFAEWLLPKPLLGPLLPASASFVALNAVLPGLGLSTRASLWTAAFTAAFGVVLLAVSNVPKAERKRVAIRTLSPCLGLPLALQLGASRTIPATPLRLTKIEIGTQSAEQWVADHVTELQVAPAHLFCASALWSPVGVHDRLFHVWRRNAQPHARIELDIRADAYRTRSRIDLAPGSGAGQYTCEVQTATGQFLGHESVAIGSAAAH